MHYQRWRRGEKLPTVLSQQKASPLALPPSEADLRYLAALLDRGGIISLRSYDTHWRVRVTSTDKEVIDWLARIGGTTSSQARGRNRKVMREWTLAYQKDVHDLLSAVLPYMKNPTKREQAAEAIDAISTREAPPLRPGRGRPLERTDGSA